MVVMTTRVNLGVLTMVNLGYEYLTLRASGTFWLVFRDASETGNIV